MTRVFNKMKTLMACSALATIALSPSVQAELASDLQDGVSALMTQSKWTGAQRQRSLTIMHLAMFDAANATQGVYAPYAYAGKIDTSASPQAADDAPCAAVETPLFVSASPNAQEGTAEE